MGVVRGTNPPDTIIIGCGCGDVNRLAAVVAATPLATEIAAARLSRCAFGCWQRFHLVKTDEHCRMPSEIRAFRRIQSAASPLGATRGTAALGPTETFLCVASPQSFRWPRRGIGAVPSGAGPHRDWCFSADDRDNHDVAVV